MFGKRCKGMSLVGLIAALAWLVPTDSNAQDSLTVDSTLIKELEREMGALTQTHPTHTATANQTGRAGQTTNPDISVLGDFRSWYRPDEERSFDVEMHEVETSLRGAVDPYARADPVHGALY